MGNTGAKYGYTGTKSTGRPKLRSRVGLRINPLVGRGEVSALSVAVKEGKFGVPVSERAAILEAFADNPFLTCVHVHTGSGGMGSAGH